MSIQIQNTVIDHHVYGHHSKVNVSIQLLTVPGVSNLIERS